MKTIKVGKELMAWDTCDIAEHETKYRIEEANENGEEFDEDEIRERAYSDSVLYESEWEYLIDYLTEIIKERNPSGHWQAVVNNFGWRNQDGEKEFDATDGKTMLQAILPQTDCTFHVFRWGRKGLAIQNYHHNSPTGNEWYYLRPAK